MFDKMTALKDKLIDKEWLKTYIQNKFGKAAPEIDGILIVLEEDHL
jgi:hypothetical protein